jgi:hypothetical protein
MAEISDQTEREIAKLVDTLGVARRNRSVVLYVAMALLLLFAVAALLWTISAVNDRLAQVSILDAQIVDREALLREKEREFASVQQQLDVAVTQLDRARGELTKLPSNETTRSLKETLGSLDTSIGDALIASGSDLTKPPTPAGVDPAGPRTGAPLKTLADLIQDLFAPTASVRTEAYRQLMSRYDTSPDLVPELLAYARSHMENENGVYNTLVILSHLNYAKLPDVDYPAIRQFAELARAKGPRISQRADILLERLPN